MLSDLEEILIRMWVISGMIHQCYFCEQIFNTKEKLYQHLEEHSKTKNEQEKEKQQNEKKQSKTN